MKPAVSKERSHAPDPADRLDLDPELLPAILQQLPAALLIARAPAGPVVFAGEDACRLLGRSAGEITASLEPGALSPEGRPYPPGEFPLVRTIARGEVAHNEEILYDRPDGTRLALRVNAVPLHDRSGARTAGLLLLTDVSALRRSETLVRSSRNELLDFFENAVEGLHWAGPDGTLLWANQAELDLLGYAPEEYLGHNLAEFHADPEVLDELLARLRRNETARDQEARLRCKDGSIKHVLINANALWFEGQFIHTRCFTRDVTARRLLEEQRRRRVEELAEADRRKNEFLAMLGHELRNPLAAASAALELMQARAPDPAFIERCRELIARQVRQMARLTDDLLDLSRITYGNLELRKERVDLAALVGRALETARPLLDAGRREVWVSPLPERISIAADPARLEQVLVNLLANAARHAGAESEIRLEVEYGDGEAIFRVRDSGAGIAPEMLPRIFEPFIRVAAPGADESGGLGLGLALVRRLVELHEGSVAAFSEGLGRGSEFIVRLPGAVKEEERAPAAGARLAGAAPAERRILLVDDNVDAAVSLGEILQILGHDVCVAHSGPEAIEAARRHRPEVVLLDIGMPGMDGYEVARRLREAGALDGALIVAMTGFGQDRDRRRSQEEGFHHHLVKPVEVDSILALLARE